MRKRGRDGYCLGEGRNKGHSPSLLGEGVRGWGHLKPINYVKPINYEKTIYPFGIFLFCTLCRRTKVRLAGNDI